MKDIISAAVLLAVIAAAIYGTYRRVKYGSSCCGTDVRPEKKIKTRGRKRSDYPYVYILGVDGMHCANCARRIENSFNESEDRWATADLGKKKVELLSKREEKEDEVGRIVSSSGYTMLSFERKS